MHRGISNRARSALSGPGEPARYRDTAAGNVDVMKSKAAWCVLGVLATGCPDAEMAEASDETTGDDGAMVDPGLPGPGWTWRREITIDPGVLGQGLTDFPLLVRLDNSRIEYDATNAVVPDVRFYDGEIATALDFEVERWNPQGNSYFWVRIPALEDTDAARSFWIYYGNDAPPAAPASTAVWTDSFVGVWHMEEAAAGGVADSTGHGHDGVLDGGGAQLRVADPLGGALQIDASSSVLRVPADPSLFPGQSMTVEGWVNPARVDGTSRRAIVRMRDSFELRSISEDSGDPGTAQGAVWFQTSTERNVTASGPTAEGAWTYFAMTFDQASGDFTLYRDGAVDQTRDPPAEPMVDGGTDVEMGLEAYGLVDEVRVSSVARSAAWMSAQNLSMTDTLLTFGPAVPAPG